MFDRLIELLTSWGNRLLPFTVVHAYSMALVLRFGRVHRELDTGFHWVWPFAEQVLYLSRAWRVAELQAQALVTADGKPVIAGIVVTYRVRNAVKSLMEVQDVFTAAQDSCQATFAQHVLSTDYDKLRTNEFAEAVLEDARAQGFKYGIEIAKVRLHELAPARTIRIVGNGEVTHS